MNGNLDSEQVAPRASTIWERTADWLARYAWLILLASVVIALVGGMITAIIWQPVESTGGMPGLWDLPMIITMLGYLLVILLGVPSLLAGLWNLLRGRWAAAGLRMLPFVGPLLFFVGTETVPHILNPCSIPWELGVRDLPRICESDPAWGADVESRYHLLDHTLVGALPMAALYWRALRKWRPDIARPW